MLVGRPLALGLGMFAFMFGIIQGELGLRLGALRAHGLGFEGRYAYQALTAAPVTKSGPVLMRRYESSSQ
jgi:hypothetical protein